MLDDFKAITTFILDIDGVLTDGLLYVFDSGEQVRCMNIKDGYALQLAVTAGYRVAAFSGSESPAVTKRLARLGIDDVFMKVENKLRSIDNYLQQHQVQWKQVLFMGDDIPDLEVIIKAGVGCAPFDAVHEVLEVARYISPYNGGKGCVRDVIEKVMRLNGHWTNDVGVPSR
jgi:3-deoxy-D-manno-octulosonate 8-phosphate phosphatase (KDO 8-P phosphatase)